MTKSTNEISEYFHSKNKNLSGNPDSCSLINLTNICCFDNPIIINQHILKHDIIIMLFLDGENDFILTIEDSYM